MLKVARFVSTVLAVLLVTTAAFAQDKNVVNNEQFGVEITAPEKWEVTSGNDKAVANFKHSASQSQIEVVGTKLMTPDVADVFFKTFHKTLTESNFEQNSQEETTIGGIEGTKSTYAFTHSGVTLEVSIFQFTKDSNAWLVVGYFQDAEKEKYSEDFTSVIENMEFSGEE
ncbi:MAG: hypothetical protein ACQEVA_15150 [Myxococcota bacterium]